MLHVAGILAQMPGNEPKVMVIDNLAPVIKHPDFLSTFPSLLESLAANNALLLFSIDLDQYSTLKSDDLQRIWGSNLGCQIILSDENEELDLVKVLHLTEAENEKVKSFKVLSRLFLMKQNNN